jgi:hypothetical protein
MNNYRLTLINRVFAILVIAGMLLVPSTSALANIRIEGGNVPFYARFALDEFYYDEGLVVIVFYRPPTCIPADFNLLDFYDAPRAFDCSPQTTEGFEIWENGPDIDPEPRLTELHGLGAVPVWFASLPELQAEMADGIVTIGDLTALNPMIGSASIFHETLRFGKPIPRGTLEINAKGELSNGQIFYLHVINVDWTKINTRIVIK